MIDNKPFITVVVPVYNGRDFLRKCLDAVFASNYRGFEVIVVDDCSTDDSAEIGRRKGARIIATTERSGPGAARNLASKSAAGEILMFVDADVVVRPDTLGKMAARFESSPDLSAVFGSYDDEPAEKNFLSQYKNLQHHFVHQRSLSEASTFWSGLGAMRRSVFVEHGGFDCKTYAEPSIEDIDLGSRLRSAGQRILLDREIQAKHLKKWTIVSHLRTEIFSRALPWSKLILERKGLFNDMNLRSSDRLSAVLAGLSIALILLAYWVPVLGLIAIAFLAAIAVLNWKIFNFFVKKRGIIFAAMAFPWQLLYYLYSGTTFVLCWFWITISRTLGFRNREIVHESGR